MSKNITKHMLRQKLTGVVNTTNKANTFLSSAGVSTEETKENRTLKIVEKEFNKIQNGKIICTDETIATIIHPIPNIRWKCLVTQESNGLQRLKDTLTAVIIVTEKTNYCIGYSGNSTQLELIIDYGDSEIRLNNTFLSLLSEHLVVNGLEKTE